jgi:hypothetical protein
VLDTSASNLLAEVEAAERFRDSHVDDWDAMRQEYAGSGYRQDWGGSWSENHMYEFIRLTTSRVIYDNPRVRVTTRRIATQKPTAKALQHGLNRWAKDEDLRSTLKRVYAAECFNFCPVMLSSRRQKWQDPKSRVQAWWPQVYVLDQEMFGFDPLCKHFSQARYVFHRWVKDKEDIVKEGEGAGWDVEAVEALTTGLPREDNKFQEDRERYEVDRKEVTGYEVWVPEDNSLGSPKNGYHGTIYTIGVSGRNDNRKVEYLKKPKAFYGPPCGPYYLFGVYPVPGDPYPLSPFSAMRRQMTDLNDAVTASIEAIRQYKKNYVYDAANPDLQKKLHKLPNAHGVAVKGFNKDSIVQVEAGGITPQHVEHLKMLQDRLDRNTGLSNAHRGDLKSDVTATAVAVADSGANDSLAYIKQEFASSVVQVLKGVAWYLYHDDRAVFPLGEGGKKDQIFNEETGQPMGEPWFRGGGHHSKHGETFDDLELEIEPYSMERANEALMRANFTEAMTLVTNAAPMIAQTPYYDWGIWFEKLGNAFNDSDFAAIYDDEAAAEAQAQMMVEAGAGGGSAPATPGVSGIASSGPSGGLLGMGAA